MRPRKKKLKTHLPKREIEICLRAKAAREMLGLTQESCARQLGLKKVSISNYELCRAPIRAEIGLLLCQRLVISERWLATGAGDPRKCLTLQVSASAKRIPTGTLFSTAFDGFLLTEADRREKDSSDVFFLKYFDAAAVQNPDRFFFKNVLNLLLDRWLSMIPKADQFLFFTNVVKAGYDALPKRQKM